MLSSISFFVQSNFSGCFQWKHDPACALCEQQVSVLTSIPPHAEKKRTRKQVPEVITDFLTFLTEKHLKREKGQDSSFYKIE